MFGGQHIEDFNFEYSASTFCSSLSMKIKIEIFEYNYTTMIIQYIYTTIIYEFCLNLIPNEINHEFSLTIFLKVKKED